MMTNTFPPASSGGGGISGEEVPNYEINYTEVATYADLPAANTQANEVYIVRQDSGTWLLGTKKKAGLYYSNGVAWSYMGNSVSIDDTATSNESVWSSGKTNTMLGGKADTAHTHTGVYEPADATILKSSSIGSTVQGYDANTAKTNVAQTFTAAQRTSASAQDNSIDFTANNNFTITATAANITVENMAGCVGQSGVIVINSANNITGWGAQFVFKTVPTGLTGTEIFAYYIHSDTVIYIGKTS